MQNFLVAVLKFFDIIVVTIISIVILLAIVSAVYNRPQPLGAEDAYEIITSRGDNPAIYHRLLEARRLRNRRVIVYTSTVWTNPSGGIDGENIDGNTYILQGDDVILFAGEEHPGQNIFLAKKGGKMILFLRMYVK